MTWIQRYRLRHYVSNSIWILPLAAMVAAVVLNRLLAWLEATMGWRSGLDPGTTQVVLGTMASAMFTFIVFVSSALLVAVQLASSTLTPRMIGIVFKDPITQLSLVVFVFAFSFTVAALVRITDSVPPVSAYVAGYSCIASLAVFLILIDHVGKSLRPSGSLWLVAAKGRKVIAEVYPRKLSDKSMPRAGNLEVQSLSLTRTINSNRFGVVLAFDVKGLTALAERHDCIIELVPQVGDFVALGDPLFRIHQGGASMPDEALRDSVAVGRERTLEQDPAFALRIIVDIASKGLSPAINDPTTAVLALDQLHHLLRDLGGRHLDDDRVRDAGGRLRLVYRTPDWVDYVHLAVTEIRQFGGTSIQIARRLRAMLENLIQTLPEDRTTLLRQELKLLRRSAERFFTDPEDLALADVSDSQGVGGKPARNVLHSVTGHGPTS